MQEIAQPDNLKPRIAGNVGVVQLASGVLELLRERRILLDSIEQQIQFDNLYKRRLTGLAAQLYQR